MLWPWAISSGLLKPIPLATSSSVGSRCPSLLLQLISLVLPPSPLSLLLSLLGPQNIPSPLVLESVCLLLALGFLVVIPAVELAKFVPAYIWSISLVLGLTDSVLGFSLLLFLLLPRTTVPLLILVGLTRSLSLRILWPILSWLKLL